MLMTLEHGTVCCRCYLGMNVHVSLNLPVYLTSMLLCGSAAARDRGKGSYDTGEERFWDTGKFPRALVGQLRRQPRVVKPLYTTISQCT